MIMKILLYRGMTGIMLAGWMIVMFLFSSQPAVESTEVSVSVSYRIVKVADGVFRLGMDEGELQKFAEGLDHPVRKAAHMTEYAILGLLSFAFYGGFGVCGKKWYLAALLTALVYAATDEFHQLFVPGRSGQLKDVCIDTAGAALGLIILYFIRKIARKHCEKKKLPIQ